MPGIIDTIKNFGKKSSKNLKEKKLYPIKKLMDEIGIRSDAVIGSYEDEEYPDSISIDQYILMQENDGTVRAITRLFSMPIQSLQIRVVPDINDSGERDFIETVFLKPEYAGGMSTTLPFVIADMTRAIFEGFRAYEKVYKIIETGLYAGKIGFQKIAPRDSRTVTLKVDEFGGFMGLHQRASYGSNFIEEDIPAEKCILYTFQKERHPLYGESILKTAYYHWDKKHKLYYILHKKAEIDALGLKILKLNKLMNEEELTLAEDAVDDVGFNSRVTIPPGFELEVDRSTGGYDPLSLIEHHDTQIVLSTLAQAMQMGTKQKYAYTYGKGYATQSEFIMMMLNSIMRTMEETLNIWLVAPLIDYNFASGNYPKLKFMPLKNEAQNYILSTFSKLLEKNPDSVTPEFVQRLTKEASDILGFPDVSVIESATRSFERGKKKVLDKEKQPAPATTDQVKDDILQKAVEMADDPKILEKFELLGMDYAKKMLHL